MFNYQNRLNKIAIIKSVATINSGLSIQLLEIRLKNKSPYNLYLGRENIYIFLPLLIKKPLPLQANF